MTTLDTLLRAFITSLIHHYGLGNGFSVIHEWFGLCDGLVSAMVWEVTALSRHCSATPKHRDPHRELPFGNPSEKWRQKYLADAVTKHIRYVGNAFISLVLTWFLKYTPVHQSNDNSDSALRPFDCL